MDLMQELLDGLSREAHLQELTKQAAVALEEAATTIRDLQKERAELAEVLMRWRYSCNAAVEVCEDHGLLDEYIERNALAQEHQSVTTRELWQETLAAREAQH